MAGMYIYPELNKIENEIQILKMMVRRKKNYSAGRFVSLRGLGKLKVSSAELEKSISEAQKSLVKVK